MKRIILGLALMAMSIGASAQFEAGKTYLGANVTDFSLNYTKNDKTTLSGNIMAGYFIKNDLLLYGEIGTRLNSGEDKVRNSFQMGGGARYYFDKCGIFLDGNLKYIHANTNYNDLKPEVAVGYAFFINRTVTLEPALYYSQSLNDMDYSQVGIKLGIGLNLETHKKVKELLNL